MDKIEALAKIIYESRNIVFFGGAGVSTESGVPDFRSKDGLYNKPDVRFEGYSPEYLLSHTCLVNEPKVFFEFYRQKMDARNVVPNFAHLFLAKLERLGKLKAVVTQNIDGLHQRAGSVNVLEIHGSTTENYCISCGETYPADFIFNCDKDIPTCPKCGGMVRCNVTLYEELLPEKAVNRSINAISSCDTLIIGGTSLTVYPAASYVNFFKGENLVLINKDHVEAKFNAPNYLEINAPIGEDFKKADEILSVK